MIPATTVKDGITTEWHPVPAALKRIKTLARGRTCFVHVTQQPRCIDQSAAQPGHELVRTVSGNVKVTKRIALKFVEDAYRYNADRVLVEVSYSEGCLFVG